MTTALILNVALALPAFVMSLGLALWSLRSQRGDRPHVLPARSHRPADRVTAGRGGRGPVSGHGEAWPAR